MEQKRLLLFQPTIAPYRVDMVNDLCEAFDGRVCLSYKNLLNQKFDYDRIEAMFKFEPHYLKKLVQVRSKVLCRGYWGEIDDFNPDIVMVSEFGPDAIAAILHKMIKRKRYKIVSVCDDSGDMLYGDKDFSRVHKMLRKFVAPRVDELVLVEPCACEWYQNKYGKGYWFPIIANDEVVRRRYEESLEESRRIVEKYSLEGKHVFIFVGRLVALKNVDKIIQAFASAGIEDSKLVIIGDGPDREKLENEASMSGENIIFTGRLEGNALYAWYCIADCLVLASEKELFGAVVNEMLVGGGKCIVSEVAGASCLINNGKNGFVVSPNNIEEIAWSMKAVAEEAEPLKPGRIKALRKSLMDFSYRSAIEDLTSHLRNLK